MIGWLGAAYPWVKAAHIIFVIFWMAGLFMLPRFLVYHQETPAGSPERDAWAVRERKLIAIILNPSMVAVWALGLALALNLGVAGEPWFQLKFALVVLLSGFQGWMTRYAGKLQSGATLISNRSLRMANEIPGIVVILIVILVIVRPF